MKALLHAAHRVAQAGLSDMASEANRDAAEQSLALARSALAAGNLEKAQKFADMAKRLYPSDEVSFAAACNICIGSHLMACKWSLACLHTLQHCSMHIMSSTVPRSGSGSTSCMHGSHAIFNAPVGAQGGHPDQCQKEQWPIHFK
jgi:hypothetical protein